MSVCLCGHQAAVHSAEGCAVRFGSIECPCESFSPVSGAAPEPLTTNARISAARDEGAVKGFADCEALVVTMLERFSADAGGPGRAELVGAALAVSLGQHRTDAYDPEQLATAHRRAAQPSLAAKGGRGRTLVLSPERRKEIATIASNAALTARRARAKGE